MSSEQSKVISAKGQYIRNNFDPKVHIPLVAHNKFEQIDKKRDMILQHLQSVSKTPAE
jgi:hypothetical protein